MFNSKIEAKNRWFSFNGSLVNFEHVMRVFTHPTKIGLTVEFISNAFCEYEFKNTEDRDKSLELLFKFLSN